MKKLRFSLIEIMTVILVILILVTLSIPGINSLRKKARTVICANQLRQLGVLLSTYANDNDGQLPYTIHNGDSRKGIPDSYKDNPGYGKLYGGWAGHLMPYFNVKVESWDRGKFYYDISTDDIKKPSAAMLDENYQNWRLLHNMYMEGGHDDLKTFICPEATITMDASVLSSGKTVPRISGIFPVKGSYSRYGLPSSYLGNGQLLGKGTGQSKRLEDVDQNNFLLVEGCDRGSQYLNGMSTPTDYKKVFELMGFYGGNVNVVISGQSYGAGIKSQDPTKSPGGMAFSYMHDDTEEVWYSHRNRFSISDVNLYNKKFLPTSAAFFNYDHSENKFGSLAAKLYPGENWENYETSYSKGKFKIFRYYGVDHQASSYFGEMNVLTADLSVKKSHIANMYENGRKLGQNSE